MVNRRMEVRANGAVACLVVTREDGSELSLSSDKGSLIHWSSGGDCVKDYGSFHRDPAEFVAILEEFLGGF